MFMSKNYHEVDEEHSEYSTVFPSTKILIFLGNVVVVAMAIQSFVHDQLATGSNERRYVF